MSSIVTPASGSQRPRRKPLSVRVRLYLLAIMVAVPACIYIAQAIRTDVRLEFSSAEQFMTVLARITAVDTEQFLDDSRVTMTRIARRMVVAEVKLGICDPLFRESFSLLAADAALYQAKHQGRNRVVVVELEDSRESVPLLEA